jgi:peptidoglycan/LPS O-acetylase OafA/YrhL
LASGAYSLYLSHKIVFHWVELMRPHLPAPLQWAAFGLAIVGAVGFGAALYWLVERPFLKLRDGLEGRSRSSLALAATLQETG